MSDAMDVDNAPLPLVIHFNPGKLTDLAMVSFVSDLLHYKLLQMRQSGAKEFNIGNDIANLISEISLPPDLESTFKELPKKMITRRTQWWVHHREFVFSRRRLPGDSMIDWMHHLVWLPDGSINYRQTARRLLSYDKLTNFLRFQLACEYCFVEDVEFLKETLTDGELNDVCGKLRTFDDAILKYWCVKLKLDGSFPYQSKRILRVIDLIVRSEQHYYEWSAIVYFFNELDDYDERKGCARTIISYRQPRFTLNLLSALSGSELDVILKGKYYLNIMKALVRERQYLEYTVLIWKRIVNVAQIRVLTEIINEVNDTFAKLPSKNTKHYSHGEHLCPLNDSQYESERKYVNNLLWELWQALSYLQKMYIVDDENDDFIGKVLKTTDRVMDYNSSIFPLILDLFACVDPERRLKYWNTYWPALVIGHTNQLPKINRIMNLCFETNSEMDDLKKVITTDYEIIAKRCERLISNGRIKEIQNFLEFCSVDKKSIRIMKKKIIKGIPKTDLFTFLFKFWKQPSSMADFDRYLEEIRFTREKRQSFVFKIITFADNLKKMYSILECSVLGENFQNVTKFVEKFILDEENLTRVKLMFFKKCRCSSAISIEMLFDLTAWCFSADQNIAEKFKNSESKSQSLSANKRLQQSSPIFYWFFKSYLKCRLND